MKYQTVDRLAAPDKSKIFNKFCGKKIGKSIDSISLDFNKKKSNFT